jgi:hypothetical protein
MALKVFSLRYRLETLTIESFKSFHGAVEVPLVSPTASPGQLCAIIGIRWNQSTQEQS